MGWSRAAGSFEGQTLVVQGLVHGPSGYVAIGSDIDEATQAPRGRVWLSFDGSSWELLAPSDVFAGAYLTQVVVSRDGRYLVFGRIEDLSGAQEVLSAIWESADGKTWRRTQLGLPPDLVVVQVVAGAKGYLLDGGRGRVGLERRELWLSADARIWEVVREVPSGQSIMSIAAGPEGFVAVASRQSGFYVIASGDGRGWFEAAPVLGLGHVLIASLAGDWIMARGQNGPLPVWFSPNGLDWEQVGTLGTDSEPFRGLSLVSTGDRVFAQLTVFADSSDGNPAGVWSSSDGATWEEVDAASDLFLAGAASSGETEVLAGTSAFLFRDINQ